MKKIFIENIFQLLKELEQFEYRIENIDHIWDILFSDQKNKYYHIRITKYREVFYITHINGNLCTLETNQNKEVKVMSTFGFSSFDDGHHDPEKAWSYIITSARKWLHLVKKDWIKTNKQVHESYPLKNRYGIVPNSLIRFSLTDIYRIDQELGKVKTKKFIKLVEEGYFFTKEKAQQWYAH